MSANGSAMPQQASEISDKGKGKQVEQYADMMEEDESESEESGAEQPEAEEEDNLEEIDPSNITSSRTRGKKIDWAEAEQKSKDAGDELADEDDDDDDEDFQAPDEDDAGDRMEE